MLQQFLFKANWYDDHREKETTSHGIVVAKSLVQATEKLTKRLPYLDKLEIELCLDCDDFAWMGETFYKEMKKTVNDEESCPPFYTEDEWAEECKDGDE